MPISKEQCYEHADTSFLYVTLPDLLPAGQLLVVEPALRVMTLFSFSASNNPILAQYRFPYYAFLVLQRVLDVHPKFCSHWDLLAALYPEQKVYLSPKQDEAAWRDNLRPVYRAIERMTAGLHQFGLGIYAIYGQGYHLDVLPAHNHLLDTSPRSHHCEARVAMSSCFRQPMIAAPEKEDDKTFLQENR